MTDQEKLLQYQTACVDFVNTLCEPTASNQSVILAGGKAAMAQLTLTGEFSFASTAVQRLSEWNKALIAANKT